MCSHRAHSRKWSIPRGRGGGIYLSVGEGYISKFFFLRLNDTKTHPHSTPLWYIPLLPHPPTHTRRDFGMGAMRGFWVRFGPCLGGTCVPFGRIASLRHPGGLVPASGKLNPAHGARRLGRGPDCREQGANGPAKKARTMAGLGMGPFGRPGLDYCAIYLTRSRVEYDNVGHSRNGQLPPDERASYHSVFKAHNQLLKSGASLPQDGGLCLTIQGRSGRRSSPPPLEPCAVPRLPSRPAPDTRPRLARTGPGPARQSCLFRLLSESCRLP